MVFPPIFWGVFVKSYNCAFHVIAIVSAITPPHVFTHIHYSKTTHITKTLNPNKCLLHHRIHKQNAT